MTLMVSCKHKVTSSSEARKVYELCREVTDGAKELGIQNTNIVSGKWEAKHDRAIIFINPSIVGYDRDAVRNVITTEAKKMNLLVEISE